MSPAERPCLACLGAGRIPPDWALCPTCDGLMRTWLEGGPTFGCKLTLATCRPGEIVILGTGDRGRVVRHCKRGTPSTDLALIDEFDDAEQPEPTSFPSIVGVLSVSVASWSHEDLAGESKSRGDYLDPLQRKTSAL